MGSETETGAIVRHLQTLKVAVGTAGFAAVMISRGTQRPPVLKVTNQHATQLSEVVACQRGADGGRRFWWSWGEPIASVDDIEAAVAAIKRVLAART